MIQSHISPQAIETLRGYMKDWSGWDDLKLSLGKPQQTSIGETDHLNHHITINPDEVLLNPNKVLTSVTPFRLRQEAVMTGVMLHEAAHARFSTWRPRTPKDRAIWTLADGSLVTPAIEQLAVLVEEARIEGAMATKYSPDIGKKLTDADKLTSSLLWTLLASAMKFVPATQLPTDPDEQVMSVISAWVLRSARMDRLPSYVLGGKVNFSSWSKDYLAILHKTVLNHFERLDLEHPNAGDNQASTSPSPKHKSGKTRRVLSLLQSMVAWRDIPNTPTKAYYSSRLKKRIFPAALNVEFAAEVIGLLYPHLDDDQVPTPPTSGCGFGQPQDQQDQQDQQEGGQDNGQNQQDQKDQGGQSNSDGSSSDSTGGSSSSAGSSQNQQLQQIQQQQEKLNKALQNLDRKAIQKIQQSVHEIVNSREEIKLDTVLPQYTQTPTKEDRALADQASKFLRHRIDAAEVMISSLSDTPSANVDGAALSAWKASGQVQSPHFFRRDRRDVRPSPPIQIGILVDISGSMEPMQQPSARLAWSLASAARDLSNFAGRGTQVSMSMVHWGSTARVVVGANDKVQGLHIAPCNEGTHRMGDGLELLEREMPGFLRGSDVPTNRLLIQFTDWEIFGSGFSHAKAVLDLALDTELSMISVMPDENNFLNAGLAQHNRAVGDHALSPRVKTMTFKKGDDDKVWETATALLNDSSHMKGQP